MMLRFPHWHDREHRLLGEQGGSPEVRSEQPREEFTTPDAVSELIQNSETPEQLQSALEQGRSERVGAAAAHLQPLEQKMQGTDAMVTKLRSQVADPDATKAAEKHNKLADEVANAAAGAATAGAAPKAHTDTQERMKTVSTDVPVQTKSAETPSPQAPDVKKGQKSQ